MILLSIIPLVFFSVILLQSDIFWSSLPGLLIALSTLVAAIFAGLKSMQANNNAKEANANAKESVVKTIENKAAIDAVQKTAEDVKKTTEDVKVTTNHKMDLLIEAKDATAKAISDAKIAEEREKAAFNAGKLAAMEQKEKDALLIAMPPPQMLPPQKEIPLTEKLMEKSAETIADKVVEKSADKIGEKVVEVVVDKVETENKESLQKKPD